MPLRAIANEQELIAPLMSEDEWISTKAELKSQKLDLTLPCCGSNAIMRVSKLGTKHFAHKRKTPDCDWKSESIEHLKAKAEIALACQDAGWNASTEARGDGWRADVLATKGTAKIAFEVQWSRQSRELTEDRQAAYEEAGVRGCWFFRKLPCFDTDCVDGALPMFLLECNDYEFDVTVGAVSEAATKLYARYGVARTEIVNSTQKKFALRDFTSRLLNAQVRFCKVARADNNVEIELVPQDCYGCGKSYYIFYAKSARTECGIQLFEQETWRGYTFEQMADVRRNIEKLMEVQLGDTTNLVVLRGESNIPVGYCPHCDTTLNNYFLNYKRLPEQYRRQKLEPVILRNDNNTGIKFAVTHPHWCLPEHGEFCSERITTHG